jgi:Tfp pilus assembly protein PilZ
VESGGLYAPTNYVFFLVAAIFDHMTLKGHVKKIFLKGLIVALNNQEVFLRTKPPMKLQ